MRTSSLLPLLALLAGCTTGPRPDASRGGGGGRAEETFRTGEAQYLRAQYASAASTFRGFLARHPGHAREAEARYWLGASLLVLDGDAEARTHLEAVADGRAPEDLKSRARGSLGDLHRKAGDWAAAAQRYEAAARANATGWRQDEYLYGLGLCRIRSGGGSAGRRDLERLVREFPESATADPARRILALPEGRFFVQLGAFTGPENARTAQADLRRRGVPCEVRAAGPRHLVLAGPYSSHAEAAREAERLKQKGIEAAAVP